MTATPTDVAALQSRIAELERQLAAKGDARFGALCDAIEVIVLTLDRSGNVTYCNRRLAEVTGLSKDQILAKDWFELCLPEEARDRARQIHHSNVTKDLTRHYDNEILTANGGRRSIRWHNTALEDAEGQIVGTASLGEDITELEATERQLAEREQMLDTILRTVPAGIGQVDQKRVFGWVNQTFAELVGYTSPEQLIGRPAAEVYAESGEWRRVGETKYAQIDLEGVGSVETQFKHKNGQPIDILLRSSYVVPGDPTHGTLFTALDISDLKRAHAELLRQHDQYLAILEALPEVVYVVEPQDRTVLFVNRHARELLGFDPVGRHCYEVFQGLHGPCTSCKQAALDAAPVGFVMTWEQHNAHFDRDYQVTDRSIPWPDGRNVRLEIAVDITERKRLERQVLRKQRMEAIGQLAAGIAHDFNNLLQAGVGFAELALGQLDDGHPAAELLGELLSELGRGSSMTRQLLAVGQRQPVKLVLLDLGQLVGDLMSMLRRLLGENIELTHVLRSSHPGLLVNVDRGLFEQVLLNLCLNARDALEDGGTLTVTTDAVEIDRAFAEERAWSASGKFIRLVVADNGRGMDAETRARVFEPFSVPGPGSPLGGGHFGPRHRPKGEAGLALAMVFGTVERHGGFIDVQSEVDRGTTFSIYLPRASAEPPTRAPVVVDQPRVSSRLPTGTETVLLAEDEPLVRRATSAILKRAGYRVITAVDGADAIAIYRERAAEIDLALLDVVMPKATGADVYLAIRAHDSRLPILFCSGYSSERLDERLETPDITIIAKPFDAGTLLRAVRQALDGPQQAS